MGKAGSRGRIPPRVRSSAQKAPQTRGIVLCQRGDLGEAAFIHKAIIGFVVAKPYGHNLPYDFIVEGGGGFLSVQVKACAYIFHGLYRVCTRRSKDCVVVAYTESEM
jgi:PD-(D/E)XK endonuclease